ncbi:MULTISPECIES: YisL family protein [Solibacillus]|uniref:YisL family protein n=1 Tax=Solibacillus faecavium TaxID=2762221 RepID=A0ABR8XUR4_9BACL|nr:YisL family protein [Solibacillus faecavium]MBD8035672.1 YisL family protein [Solibacillus faecavium]
MDFLSSSTHLHITAWAITLILFFVAALAGKKLTAVHMTLRVMYILVIITGLALFLEWRDKIAESGMNYDMKVLFGILVIAFMEMVLVRKNKGKSVNMFWVLFGIVLLITLYLGMSMGIGINF